MDEEQKRLERLEKARASKRKWWAKNGKEWSLKRKIKKALDKPLDKNEG